MISQHISALSVPAAGLFAERREAIQMPASSASPRNATIIPPAGGLERRPAERIALKMRSATLSLADYEIIEKGKSWTVLHDGKADGEYATKEAAFEAAVATASIAIKQGYEICISVPSTEAGK